ncbi:MAG: NAD(P)H-dependent glycerol-3-phosphate dehydrogenase [Ottowia sp.]|nr:NAD(P)-dependent glycerol-3-phosphate dehydrogenase [Ottowia sp.]
MKILVIGAGAWGTALAVSAARHTDHQVVLWARDAAQASAMEHTRENARYLPGIPLPAVLQVASSAPTDLPAIARDANLVMVATPVAGLRAILALLADVATPLAWLCKGFERMDGRVPGAAISPMPHEVQREVAPRLLAGAFSGPSFAQEVGRGQPTALVAASRHRQVRSCLVAAFHGPTMRVYENHDIIGVEVGGAVKNVLAIATGLADGLDLGLNARAALITRGLSEMSRLGLALGARSETFMGLSGMGDLVLTATGDLSRNRRVGMLLAQGKTTAEAVQSLGHVAEGVYTAHAVLERARGLGVEMPIAECVVALLDGQLKPADAVALLMERAPRDELAP